MKAIVQNRYGSADVLELREIARPTVKDDEMLVLVRAAIHAVGRASGSAGRRRSSPRSPPSSPRVR